MSIHVDRDGIMSMDPRDITFDGRMRPSATLGSPDGPVMSAVLVLSPDELKHISDVIVRKYDRHLLPIIFVAYTAFWLDRSNIALARHNGLEDELKLVGSQFNQALAVFFAMYILFNIPAHLLLRKIGGGKFLPFLIIAWGLATILSGFASNFLTLCLTRAAVGATEAGFLGATLLWLGFFYTNEEIVSRVGILLSSAPLAGAVGGLLAGAFSRINIPNFRGWPWIFIIEGVITVCVGLAAVYLVPDTPIEARFLNVEEKLVSRHRMVVIDAQGFADRVGEITIDDIMPPGDKSNDFQLPDLQANQQLTAQIQPHHFVESNARDRLKMESWRRAILHPITLILTVGCFLTIECIYAYNLFVPSLLHSMGYSGVSIALLSVPPNVTAFIFTIVITRYSQKRQRVAWSLAICGFVSFCGFTLLLIGSLAAGNNKEGLPIIISSVQYVGTFFACSGVSAATPLALSWTCVNAHPHYVRAIALGFMISVGNFATFLASFVYIKDNAPRYALAQALRFSIIN